MRENALRKNLSDFYVFFSKSGNDDEKIFKQPLCQCGVFIESEIDFCCIAKGVNHNDFFIFDSKWGEKIINFFYIFGESLKFGDRAGGFFGVGFGEMNEIDKCFFDTLRFGDEVGKKGFYPKI